MWDQTPLYDQLVAELDRDAGETRRNRPIVYPGKPDPTTEWNPFRSVAEFFSNPLARLIFGCIAVGLIAFGAALVAKGLGW